MIDKHFENVNLLTDKCSNCLIELANQRRSLMQYQEMNESLSEELYFEGCNQLGDDKWTLSKLEGLLLKRMNCLLDGGPPFRSFSLSWKEIWNEKLSSTIILTENIPNPLFNVNKNQENENIEDIESDDNENNEFPSPGYNKLYQDVKNSNIDPVDSLAARTEYLLRHTQEALTPHVFRSLESSSPSSPSSSASSYNSSNSSPR